MMRTATLTMSAVLAITSFISADATSCVTLEANKKSAVDLVDGIFNKHDASYLDKYVGSTYIQHNPTIQDGVDAVRGFIPFLGNSSKVEIGAVIAHDDLVWINTRYSGVPNLETSVGVDVYRLVNGKIVEHWDILQTEVPVEKTASGRPMFPIEDKAVKTPTACSDGCDSSNPALAANKETAKAFLDGVFNKKDVSAVDKYVGSEYLQHNPSVPDGAASLKSIIPKLSDTYKVEFGGVAASGDLVFVNTRYSGGGQATSVGLDAFRFENGKIVEHWDILQEEVPVEKTVSGHPMFPIGA